MLAACSEVAIPPVIASGFRRVICNLRSELSRDAGILQRKPFAQCNYLAHRYLLQQSTQAISALR